MEGASPGVAHTRLTSFPVRPAPTADRQGRVPARGAGFPAPPTLPGRPELPIPWLLGSSAQSAIWAGQLGLPYAFADFINAEGAEIAKLYRERFQPNEHLQASRTAVAVWTLAAPTEDEAVFLSTSSRMSFTLLRRNQLIPVPPPEKAVEFLKREGKPLGGGRPGRRSIVGSPAKVRAEVEAVAAEYGAEEVIVVTITYDHQARRRSYELLAEAFDLEPRAVTSPALSSPR